MNVLKRKLNNQKGASITFALLLFLVCAVVGSAVLVAGTAASGRMSKIPESDQRYYAVNSAAQLLVEDIQKETVLIKTVNTKSEGSTDSVLYLNGEVFKDEATPNPDKTKLKTFPQIAADQLGLLGGTVPTGSVTKEMAVTASGLTDAKKKLDALAVDISESVFPDGRLVLDISRADKDKPSYVYKLRLTFNLEKKELQELDDNTHIETITTTLNWQLRDIRVVSANPA